MSAFYSVGYVRIMNTYATIYIEPNYTIITSTKFVFYGYKISVYVEDVKKIFLFETIQNVIDRLVNVMNISEALQITIFLIDGLSPIRHEKDLRLDTSLGEILNHVKVIPQTFFPFEKIEF